MCTSVVCKGASFVSATEFFLGGGGGVADWLPRLEALDLAVVAMFDSSILFC